MEPSVGEQIASARRRRGWDQAELARLLGKEVRQQTVSRWESGGSRPRRGIVVKLAQLFEVDPEELLASAGYTPFADQPVEVPRPVRPLLTVLPLWELAPDKFEELIADVGQALHPSAHVFRFGGQGHTQQGVDVVAEESSRYVATYQCKRHKEFGPEKIKEAVGEVTVTADAYFLVLSRKNASPGARLEMKVHPHWTLWDAEDVSRTIRMLPIDGAIRIVDTYFPGWRKAALGVDEPGPWLTTEEFFRPLTIGSIYTHDWQLVGRTGELDALLNFVSDPSPPIGLLIGRGGIGKSRLLREVAECAERADVFVRFVKPGASLQPEHSEMLPRDQRVLVIFDDVHDFDDVLAGLGDLLRLGTNVKILLALRPHGVSQLDGALGHLGVRVSDLRQWTLTDLADREAQILAGEALGPEWSTTFAERLGRLTADCPFITVVAGALIRRGDLDPACLDHEDTIRKEVLHRFRDVVVADPVVGEPELRRAVLDGVAALQPFRADDLAFQTSLAMLVERPYDRTVTHIRGLENAGVLLRRGSSLRIVPDLLGDVILADACFDASAGVSTGYLERVWAGAEGETVAHIFINAARLDWQVSHDRPSSPRLAAILWDAVEDAVKSAGIVGRINMVRLLQKVAYFEPNRSLCLVRWLIDHPTDELEDVDQPFLRVYRPTAVDVLYEFPTVLRLIGYDLNYIKDAADVLWELAATDTRQTNPYPDHPLRVLQGLAGFDVVKPIAYNWGVLDAAERWLERGEAAPSGASPFDVLEPLLATEGMTNRTEGFQLQFQPYTINLDTVRPIRERALSLALREVAKPSVKGAVRAVSFLAAGLHYPIGSFGRLVTDNEREAWTPDFVNSIRRLGEVVKAAQLDPLVLIAIRQTLHWHVEHSRTATHSAARQLWDSLPDSLEYRVALALFDGWGQLLEASSRESEQVEAEREARTSSLAYELVLTCSDTELCDLIAGRLQMQISAFGSGQGNAGPFVAALVKARPSGGVELCSRIVAEPTSTVASVLPVVLAVLADELPDEFIDRARELLATGCLSMRRGVAQALGWNRGARVILLEGEREVLQELAADGDASVRQMVVRAAQRLAPHQRPVAIDLICRVHFGDSPKVADDLLQMFSPSGELQWQQLSKPESDRILLQLIDCPSISSFWVTRFLSELSKDEPDLFVRLLVERVQHWEKLVLVVGEYQPLPLEWIHRPQVRAHKDFVPILHEIRDWIAAEPDSWKRQEMGGRLFSAVAAPFDRAVLAVLDEAIAADDRAKMVAAASLLRRAPRTLVFENVDFVCRALAAASKMGGGMVEQMSGAFDSAAVRGIRHGVPGEPFPEDVEQRERSRTIAETLRRGSVEEKLYRSLEQSAKRSISWYADQDDKLIDGREW